MYGPPCLPSSCTCSRIAVRSLVFSSSDPQPALPRSTLASRMTSFSCDAWSELAGSGLAVDVLGFGLPVFPGAGVDAPGLAEACAEGAAGEGAAGERVPDEGAPAEGAPGAGAADAGSAAGSAI